MRLVTYAGSQLSGNKILKINETNNKINVISEANKFVISFYNIYISYITLAIILDALLNLTTSNILYYYF